jgi:hypothetical protein
MTLGHAARGHSALFTTLIVLGSAAMCLFATACSGKEQSKAPYVQPQKVLESTCADDAFVLTDKNEAAPAADCADQPEGVRCYGFWAARCDGDGQVQSLDNCRLDEDVCMPGKCESGVCGGCVDCRPGTTRCGNAGERYECNDSGSTYELVETCNEAAGERCSLRSGRCENLCDAAARAESYTGCEYYAVATANSQLEFQSIDQAGLCQPFPFAVVIANTEGVSAEVHISSAGFEEQVVTVAPDETATVRLPCSLELKGVAGEMLPSVRARDAAHRIVSNVPITVYQFNPLEFEGETEAGESFYSYTNDASLLLPVHALTGNYRVMARATMQQHLEAIEAAGIPAQIRSLPGYVAITGVEDEPTEVLIRSSAYTRPSADGSVPALVPGEAFRTRLARGDVLQLVSDTPRKCKVGSSDSSGLGDITYCVVSAEYDLTGTEITAEGRVSVISGHDCTFVPYDRWACDHLEESMLPLESWGQDFYMTVSATTDCREDAPNLFRILAAHDDTHVSFTPEVTGSVTLQRGDYVELESTRSFQLRADKAVLVAQFLLGQDYEGKGQSSSYFNGDPSLSLGIPVEQWRSSYSFLTPSTYTENFVNVVAHEGSTVLIDGRVIGGFATIEGTQMVVGRVRVDEGPHIIESSAVFGFVAYGFAPYTSYMVPGGLDLHPINAPD